MRFVKLWMGIFCMAGLIGCAQEVRLPSSAELPAAMGEAKVYKDDNGNTKIKLEVKHFAPPQRLQPPRSVYVVWAETSDNQMFNLGRLKINEDLKGKLEATTPFRVFQLVITAEDNPLVMQPSQQVVLRTKVIEANE